MKRMMTTIVVLMTWMASAMAFNYGTARNEALFLTDKMAYELNLSQMQYEAVYEINLDYLLSVSQSSMIYGTYWKRRNTDLKYVLSSSQFRAYKRIDYFYRPLSYSGNSWYMGVYSHYTNRSNFYYARPSNYNTYYGGYNRTATSHYKGRTYNPPTATTNHGNRPQPNQNNGRPMYQNNQGGNGNAATNGQNGRSFGNNGRNTNGNSGGNAVNNGRNTNGNNGGNAVNKPRQSPSENGNRSNSSGSGNFNGRR